MTLYDLVAPRGNGVRMPAAPVRPQIPIAIYGNAWCGETQLIRRALNRAGIEYAYVDLDLHPDVHRRLQALAGGRLRTPVVHIDGEWLMEPTLREVDAVLASRGVRR